MRTLRTKRSEPTWLSESQKAAIARVKSGIGEIQCPRCGAKKGEQCVDLVDNVLKQNFHAERANEATRRGHVRPSKI